MTKKSITVTANQTGWYLIKTACDEGVIVTNVKLEAGVPCELSFVDQRRRDQPMPQEHKPFRDTKSFRGRCQTNAKYNKYKSFNKRDEA